MLDALTGVVAEFIPFDAAITEQPTRMRLPDDSTGPSTPILGQTLSLQQIQSLPRGLPRYAVLSYELFHGRKPVARLEEALLDALP